MILHIVVAVEDIMLPVVLVLGGDDNLAEPQAELLPGVDAEILPGVGVAAPGGVNLGQVLHRFPVTLVQHRQNARSVGARLAAENPVQGPGRATAGRIVVGWRIDVCGPAFPVLVKMLQDVVFFRGLVQRGHAFDGLVQQVNQVGEGIAEEPAYTDGYVNAGRPNSETGIISVPETRRLSCCQTGRTPSKYIIWAMSSPWVRIADVPQTTMPTISG